MKNASSEIETPIECDECGKRHSVSQRIYQGRRYCATCYARVFKRRMCPGCGNFARLPRNDPHAKCGRCLTNKPCVRCGAVGFDVAKITELGPVCNVCSPYFREEEHCEQCGKTSRYLTRVSRFGHDKRLCPHCARADHKTCQACGRHRLLSTSPDGRELCQKCLIEGNIPCPQCSEPMPAGCGKQCWNCYWNALLTKRVNMDCAILSNKEIATRFKRYGEWLRNEIGPQRAALTIHKHVAFFEQLERHWQQLPDSADLLSHFGTRFLRKYHLTMKWLEEEGNGVLTTEQKQLDSDRRRIQATLRGFPEDSESRQVLDGFFEVLWAKVSQQKTSIRSMRLALTPAAALMREAVAKGLALPDQGCLNDYLHKTPGQKAALSAFITYLAERHGVVLSPPSHNRGQSAFKRRSQLSKKILDLVENTQAYPDVQKEWIALALAYFHDLPIKMGRAIRSQDIRDEGNQGLSVTIGVEKYWIPSVTSLLELAPNLSNIDKLNHGQPLTSR